MIRQESGEDLGSSRALVIEIDAFRLMKAAEQEKIPRTDGSTGRTRGSKVPDSDPKFRENSGDNFLSHILFKPLGTFGAFGTTIW